MSDSKVIRKILRSLPKRFQLKITTIEERKDIDILKLDELCRKSTNLLGKLPPKKKGNLRALY